MARITDSNGLIQCVCAEEVGSTLKDGSMEQHGTANWTATNATLSKEAGARTGGSGSFFLRITPSAAADASASQAILSVGAKYRVNGWARSNNVARPAGVYSGTTELWRDAAVTGNWVSFSVLFDATGTSLKLFNIDDGATTNTVDFDDVELHGDVPETRIGGSGTDEAGEIDPSGSTDINGNLICKSYA